MNESMQAWQVNISGHYSIVNMAPLAVSLLISIFSGPVFAKLMGVSKELIIGLAKLYSVLGDSGYWSKKIKRCGRKSQDLVEHNQDKDMGGCIGSK